MATNTKMLELTFNVEGGRSMILSIHSPKEDLTLATQRLFHIDCYRPLRMTARGKIEKPSPHGEGGEHSEPDRVLAV